MSLYGTRDAATNWQEEIAKLLVWHGFRRDQYNPCLYWSQKLGVKTLVHGDDFVSVGTRSAIGKVNEILRSRFDIKTSVIGPSPTASCADYAGQVGGDHEAREGKVLNRILRYTEAGFELEADRATLR